MDFADIRNCCEKEKYIRASETEKKHLIIKCLPCADDITSVNDHFNDGSQCTQLIYNTPTVRHHCDERCRKHTQAKAV